MSLKPARLQIKVVPGSSRDCIAGWLGDIVRVKVSAPPERGQANAAVERLLEVTLGLPRGAASVVSGNTSPRKTIEIMGLSPDLVQQRLRLVVPG